MFDVTLFTAITFFVIAWMVSKRQDPSGKSGPPWWLNEAITAIGGGLLAASSVGGLISQGFGTLPAGLTLMISVIIGVAIAFDLAWDRNSNKVAVVGLALWPSITVGIGGIFGEAGSVMRDLGSQLGNTIMTALVG